MKVGKCFKTPKQRQNKTLITPIISKHFFLKKYCLNIVKIFKRYVNKNGPYNFKNMCVNRKNTNIVV